MSFSFPLAVTDSREEALAYLPAGTLTHKQVGRSDLALHALWNSGIRNWDSFTGEIHMEKTKVTKLFP